VLSGRSVQMGSVPVRNEKKNNGSRMVQWRSYGLHL